MESHLWHILNLLLAASRTIQTVQLVHNAVVVFSPFFVDEMITIICFCNKMITIILGKTVQTVCIYDTYWIRSWLHLEQFKPCNLFAMLLLFLYFCDKMKTIILGKRVQTVCRRCNFGNKTCAPYHQRKSKAVLFDLITITKKLLLIGKTLNLKIRSSAANQY